MTNLIHCFVLRKSTIFQNKVIDGHIVIVKEYENKYAEHFSYHNKKLFVEDNVKTNHQNSISELRLIDVYNDRLEKISSAAIKSCDSVDSSVFTCGDGILIQSVLMQIKGNKENKNRKPKSHIFALYSLKMKLKQKRIRIEMESEELTPDEFAPIKFDVNT